MKTFDKLIEDYYYRDEQPAKVEPKGPSSRGENTDKRFLLWWSKSSMLANEYAAELYYRAENQGYKFEVDKETAFKHFNPSDKEHTGWLVATGWKNEADARDWFEHTLSMLEDEDNEVNRRFIGLTSDFDN